jgi:hypothetical protein
MMTPEQRYLFDLNGYLHLENVIAGKELEACQRAVEDYISTPAAELPVDFGTTNGRMFENGFAWDKCLEALVFHPAYWSIIREFTARKPRFLRGTMLVNMPGDDQVHAGSFHCAREDYGWYSTRYECRDSQIYCDDFVIFPYFYDVHPGDGGLAVLPGSHKSNFPRPKTLFNGGDLTDGLPDHALNLTPKAGDVVIISELLTHGALRWTPEDRKRAVLALRYSPQFRGGDYITDAIRARLSPETLELMAPGAYWEEKEIVGRDVVTLS